MLTHLHVSPSRTVKVTRCYLAGCDRPFAEIIGEPAYSHWTDVRRSFADWADCALDEVKWDDGEEVVTVRGEPVGTIVSSIGRAR